jgi:hypothetical protein
MEWEIRRVWRQRRNEEMVHKMCLRDEVNENEIGEPCSTVDTEKYTQNEVIGLVRRQRYGLILK